MSGSPGAPQVQNRKAAVTNALLPLSVRLTKKVECNIYVSQCTGWGAGLKHEQNIFSREFPSEVKEQNKVPGIKFLNVFNAAGHKGEYDYRTQAFWFGQNKPSFASVFADDSKDMKNVLTEGHIMEDEAFTFIHLTTGREIDFEKALEIMANFDENGEEYRFPDQTRISPFKKQKPSSNGESSKNGEASK